MSSLCLRVFVLNKSALIRTIRVRKENSFECFAGFGYKYKFTINFR